MCFFPNMESDTMTPWVSTDLAFPMDGHWEFRSWGSLVLRKDWVRSSSECRIVAIIQSSSCIFFEGQDSPSENHCLILYFSCFGKILIFSHSSPIATTNILHPHPPFYTSPHLLRLQSASELQPAVRTWLRWVRHVQDRALRRWRRPCHPGE